MVFLFRRFRKEKKDEEEAPVVESTAPTGEPAPSSPPKGSLDAEALGQTASDSVPGPTPSPRPPPWPTAAPSTAPITPAVPSEECFLCGTALEDHRCPNCQMTWIE